ncbi:GntR family transcriptional regulator [Roseibium sediminicola]|uniref:GntR family transcriptional regulator n=1 Tax=Roseibium sediminicola TaxID=2933272 RepID=A0ABT0GVH4_9HYPH|nr:GntR family transcriptional regulator [Roseibium sp. CAU 1639]MCK7612808.1 GntR family transcriptional regulator [Roseibium sp. CAU 1639]
MSSKAKSTRVDNAYERLKSEILKGDLPPGFQAPEPDIANRLGMSRTPVREALIRLEADGLVGLVPRRGAKVLPMSRKDICEIYQILSALEALAARSAATKRGGDAVDGVRELLDRADEALDKCDIEAWAVFDDRFHRWVASVSGNARLEAEVAGFLDQAYRASNVLLRLNKAPASNAADHRRLVDAIEAGDGDAAAEIARVHRLTGLTRMKAVLESCGLSHV